MTKVVILGGTGYTGTAYVKEALRRGFGVVAVSRRQPEEALESVQYMVGSVLDEAFLTQALAGADVIIGALAPRGDMAGKVGELYKDLAYRAAESGQRLVITGGFSTLRPAEGEPQFVKGEIPAAFAAEATEIANVYDYLKAESPENLDWLFVAPAEQYGAYAPGAPTGRYRVGGEVALRDANGISAISSEDFALGVMDEIEHPARHHQLISLAY